MPEYYEIRIKRQMDRGWSEVFAGVALSHLEGNVTLPSGTLPGLLERIRDLNTG